ncbi:MAG: response regulator [Dissulfurispiraceae bacterium]
MLEDSELRECFLLEAEDYITILNRGILELGNSPRNDALLEDLFRVAHTLKGAAALMSLTVTSNIAHKMEDILEDLKDRKIELDPNVTRLLLYQVDALTGLIHDTAEGKGERHEIEEQVLQKVEELFAKDRATDAPFEVWSSTKPIPLEAERRRSPGRRKEDKEFFSGTFVKVDIRKVEQMLNLMNEATIKKNYLIEKAKKAGEIADEILFSGKRLNREVNTFVDQYAYTLSRKRNYIEPLSSEFGELEFDRYDEQNLFSRKLQEIANDLTEAIKEFSELYELFYDDVRSLNNLIKLLRSNVSETRMAEIGKLFLRFLRPVKDLAGQFGKEVSLQVLGGDTKIDRVIFERLFDPLMHLMRNAIGHGIEEIDVRLKKGKTKEGLILFSVKSQNDTIILEISDDGRGIDTDELFMESVKRELFRPEDNPSREELLSLIFLPWFTTAESPDLTSGRGMGMSAVRKELATINATIDVSSELGKGTTFRIRVPSVLAIMNLIVFNYKNIEFEIPVNLIEEIIKFDSSDLIEGSPHMMNYKGKPIQVKSFDEVFRSANKAISGQFVLICNLSNKKVGLIVDNVLGQEETIIKPLNNFLEGLSLYAGTTIAGDGKVRFVINPIIIFEDQVYSFSNPALESESSEAKKILVVDDSLSVRKYVSSFLEDKQLKVYTASNGIEALKMLDVDEVQVDLIISDLEMPEMHGYELISRIKDSARLKRIPIVVLTSRGTDKHREKAVELGAADYLIKPFDEKALMNILKKFLLIPA